MDLLTIVFYIFFLVLFPLGETVRFTFGKGIAATPMDMGIILLLLLWISRSWMSIRFTYAFQKPILFVIAAFLLSLMISAFFYPLNELWVGFLYLIRYIFSQSVYFLVRNEKNLAKHVPFVLISCGVIMVLLGYLQFFFYPQLRNLLYLGWDEHYYRMFGTFLDPNFFGAFLGVYATLVLGLVFKKKRITKIFLVCLFFITLVAIFLTFSRSAYLLTIVSLISLLVFMKRRIALFMLFLIFSLFALFYSVVIKNPHEGMNLFRETSTLARIGSMKNAWILFLDHPIFGVGFNMYRYAQHNGGLLPGTDWQESHAGAGTDNSFLFILGTTGILGFLAYVFFLYTVFSYLVKRIKHNVYASITFASLIGLLIDSFFVNSLFYPFTIIFLYTLLGMIE